jgi:hypothetical protein
MINWVVTLISPLSQRRRVQKRLRPRQNRALFLETLNTIHKVLEEENIKIL